MELLKLEGIEKARPSSLSEVNRFKVKLLRAVMFPEAVVVIDRPFHMIKSLPDITPIKKMLTLLDTRFEQCIIADYEWHRYKYGDLIE